ncbi:DNA adenine methylase [Nitratifractor salsuginis]|uniref:site-specific DNA-methyltransferase (adenine-specific) n=1 Tax=Nitratifractor salsuginis (strain DSM 16511 / JCM 12458 / E9I37-1) TaxID=749222 RepID=E6WZB5_NITSE|nr:DNA adenine methylase [Nitratifractor salsuginis]ADV46627.1 Site-specific DNA-methyltransferase (adenine-specific) [Nitratifractor salsuginis DSM 16511]
MNYIGSKQRLSLWIKREIEDVVGDTNEKIFCDIFAGTGIVGRIFKTSVKKVIANDVEFYSFVLNKNYIENHEPIPRSEELITKLDSLEGREGFVYNHYCLGSGSGRQYFSDENGKKIDAIRSEIEKWHLSGEIDEREYYFLLASLLESADKVANTASVYGAFLKQLKKSARKPMTLEPALFETGDNGHKVYRDDANRLIKEIEGDILYLDPPYNHRQYGANYHILNTIAEYKPFEPRGKSGLPEYYKSNYCRKREVAKNFDQLIRDAKFKYIFLSYNNEGLMSENEIKEIMSQYGQYSLLKQEYQRYKADNNREYKEEKTYEYLHILIKE